MYVASFLYHCDKMVNIASISVKLADFFFRVFEQCTKSHQNVHNFYHFDMAYPEDLLYGLETSLQHMFPGVVYLIRICPRLL